MKRPLYQEMAVLLHAINNCELSNNKEWKSKHLDKLVALVKEHMPSGSGIDRGTQLDMGKSNPAKLVFITSFHHMNETGFYDGWTEHTVTVTASLAYGMAMKISGRNRNEIKDYLHDIFQQALEAEVMP